MSDDLPLDPVTLNPGPVTFDPAPPPHPPRQPVHFGRPRPSPHLRPSHEQTMKRPAEKLHLAHHHMHPHPDQPTRGNGE
jgi:hypothetical protein